MEISEYTFLGKMTFSSLVIILITIVIATRRYGPLCGPTSSSCGGLRPSTKVFFGPLGKKKPYYAVLANFRPFLVSGSNLGIF